VSRVIPPAYFWAAIVVSVVLDRWLPISDILVSPWRWLGSLPALAGVGIALWADNQFKRVGTTVRPGGQASSLVTDGAFRLSRNPMYVGMVLALLGIAMLLGSATAFAGPLLMYLVLQLVFIPMEEHDMEAAFGDEFRRYKASVRAWL